MCFAAKLRGNGTSGLDWSLQPRSMAWFTLYYKPISDVFLSYMLLSQLGIMICRIGFGCNSTANVIAPCHSQHCLCDGSVMAA